MTLSLGVVKSAHAAANVNSVSTTTGATSTAGSGFIILAQNQGGTLSVSDNKGNTANYIPIFAQQSYNFANRGANAWYCPNGVGGTGHIATASSTGGAADMSVYFWEIATTVGNGILLDQFNVANSATLVGPAITTTVPNELLLAGFMGASTSNPATHTVSGGGGVVINANSNITNGAASLDSTGVVARNIVSTIQNNIAPTWTELGNSGGTMAMFMLSFYEFPAFTPFTPTQFFVTDTIIQQ